MSSIPMPGEWHPAYAEYNWLHDWLMGTGPYPHNEIRIAVPQRTAALQRSVDLTLEDAKIDLLYRVLVKHECAAWAPYVGEPKEYRWVAGIDDLGRAVATDSWLEPLGVWW